MLPRLGGTQLRRAPRVKLMCEIRGDSVILTPQSTRGSKEYFTDPVSGLRVSKRKPRAEAVSSDIIRKLPEEFP